jgi:hypothetical protein
MPVHTTARRYYTTVEIDPCADVQSGSSENITASSPFTCPKYHDALLLERSVQIGHRQAALLHVRLFLRHQRIPGER